MEAPPWRPLPKTFRRAVLHVTHDHRSLLTTGLLTSLTILLLAFVSIYSISSSSTKRTPTSAKLFIAIGSAPQNAHLRRTARDTWLNWLPDDTTVSYKFFTDSPPTVSRVANASIWRSLRREAVTYDDLVLQPLPGGYGTKEHNAYGQRALYQLHWSARFASSDFFLRIDDDSFLCLHRLLYELRTAPLTQFFWGRFWCREGRNRADENFMLFSRDVVNLLVSEQVGKLLPFDEDVTLGWNFGYWSWVLNLTVFDDQTRIDAQQGLLTKFMHEQGDVTQDFCERFLYAHHVTAETMRHAFEKSEKHLMYSIPVRTSPLETCLESERSFVPRRHSSKLPGLKITRANTGDG